MRIRLLITVTLVSASAIAAWVLFSSNGKTRVDAMQKEERRLASEVESLRTENDLLRKEATLLSGDADGSKARLEKVAREELGYLGEGEQLLLIEEAP